MQKLPIKFNPGLFRLVFENEVGDQFITANGYENNEVAKVAADYYLQGNFTKTNSKIIGAYVCQEIVPVYKPAN